ncbi:Flagellar biosynthesis protein FliR [Caenispirillum salinarum AK4]|uniref:Flagellar biosynthetic protein FliR n=1 Tax=Caenispirillum salinarum AK4 TaxID=1238182 RepID=K9H7W8_9PROT|nr:flagellar biosynthetic protein FliR [Caenispirillum salinarum]EKV26678.1 Flagellar biosynthesis protein FliR [Caenispirillum salinarum AK4]
MTLDEFLVTNIFAFMLVFARLGAMFMFLPGFSATYVNRKTRLAIALLLTLVVAPVVLPVLPAMPEGTAQMLLLLMHEVLIGLFMGLFAQVLMAALTVAGTSIGRDAGLMNAMVFDPVTESQGAVVISFLTLVALVLLFALEIHHLMIQALVSSYAMFTPGGDSFILADVVNVLTQGLDDAFQIGLQIASPFLVFNLTFQVGMGLLSRLSPQMNVFFIALPLQIMVGLVVLAVALPAMMLVFMRFFETRFTAFLPGLGG